MMETTEHATEADPLKREEVEGGGAAPSAQTKKSLGLGKLTHWRTAAFFTPSFSVSSSSPSFSSSPVPSGRNISPSGTAPSSKQARKRYSNTLYLRRATYDFLAIEDASKDKVMDVLFVRKDSKGSQNISCFDAEMGRPEGGVDFPRENLRGISKELIFMAMFG